LDDIKLFTKIVLNSEPWKYDVTAFNVPWQDSASSSQTRLTIGVPPEDPAFPLHPPVRRAWETAIEALERHGHKIIRLQIDEKTNLSYGNRIAFQYFIYGPHEDNISTSGEPLVKSVAKFSSPMFTGPFPVNPDADLVDKITGLHDARQGFADAWRKTWVDHRLDVLLAPGSQSTAVPHDTYGWPPYTLIWNLLDVSNAIFFLEI
jgi:amidase